MSQIATTIEQSQKLLKAGIAVTCCDMEWINVDVWDSEERKMVGKWFLSSNPCLSIEHPKYVPAWSLSKLWDICNDSGIGPLNFGGDDLDSSSLMDKLVKWIILGIFDHEVLDEYLTAETIQELNRDYANH